jgi:cyclic-di-GMP phosphodiesterase TipF (flagellum assembly factor)
MIRLSALFVAICMVLIASAFGAVLYLGFGLTGAEGVAVAVAALTGLAIYNTVAIRARYQNDLMAQIADLSRGTADLARQVAEQGRHIAALEKGADAAVDKALAATQPIQVEIGELGGLVSQLAQTVAAQEIAWRFAGSDQKARPQPASDLMAAAAWKPILPVGQSAASLPPDEVTPSAQRAAGEIEPPPITALPDDQNRPADGPFRGMSRPAVIRLVGDAVGENRIELFLQPIVTLPQRRVRYYEALVRLRMPDDRIVTATDFLPFAQAGGLLPEIDNLILTRCVRVVRRLQAKNRDVGVFFNLSGATLSNADMFARILDIAEANRALAPALMFELPYPLLRAMGARENENVSALTDLGYRLSVDHVNDLRFDAADLAARKCGFVKISAGVLLDRGNQATAKIHLADLSGLLTRFGIDLIAEKIESESTVVDLFDFDVKYGQGNLFSPPRPIRPESMTAAEDTESGTEQMLESGAAPAAPSRPAAAPVMRSTAERGSALTQLARAASRP